MDVHINVHNSIKKNLSGFVSETFNVVMMVSHTVIDVLVVIIHAFSLSRFTLYGPKC